MPAPGRFIAWCKQERASLEKQLEMMESGKVRTGGGHRVRLDRYDRAVDGTG
jgi:hypothetical protein